MIAVNYSFSIDLKTIFPQYDDSQNWAFGMAYDFDNELLQRRLTSMGLTCSVTGSWAGSTIRVVVAAMSDAWAGMSQQSVLDNIRGVIYSQGIGNSTTATFPNTNNGGYVGGNTSSGILTASNVHVVSRGESLSSIASKYKTSVASIVALNNISNPNLIYVGQRLQIPSSGSVNSAINYSVSPSGLIRDVTNGVSNVANALGNTVGNTTNAVTQAAGASFFDNLATGLGISTPIVIAAVVVGAVIILKK